MKELSTLDAFDDVVAKIALVTARNFPDIDPEDISQHLHLAILQNRAEFKNPDAPGVAGALWVIGQWYAIKLRTEHLHSSPQYTYRPGDVRKILEHTFSQDQWYDTSVPEDARSIKDSADELDLQSDIKWAWGELEPPEKILIFRRYALKDELDGADRRKLNRAVAKLVEVVNTYRGAYE